MGVVQTAPHCWPLKRRRHVRQLLPRPQLATCTTPVLNAAVLGHQTSITLGAPVHDCPLQARHSAAGAHVTKLR